MIAPEGHVSLASLWTEFASTCGSFCWAEACKAYASNDFTHATDIGSPMDLCEEAFLGLFDPIDLRLAEPLGSTCSIPASGRHALERALLQTGVLEATTIYNEVGNGEEGELLDLIGSALFEPWPQDTAISDWAEAYPASDLETERRSLDSIPFHTLPVLFIRERYTLPPRRPSWTGDLIEAAHADALFPAYAGRSICVRQDDAEKLRRHFRKDHVRQTVDRILQREPIKNVGGRPRKVEAVMEVIRREGLHERQLSNKERRNEVERHLGEKISESTLGRAMKRLRS